MITVPIDPETESIKYNFNCVLPPIFDNMVKEGITNIVRAFIYNSEFSKYYHSLFLVNMRD